ncbi:ornithine cyclodeaminase family protein [Candidatus Bathyarchaeota archaeon]|nr:MAG: ornithine cyclodeaminase family protein [Candidatus Bathyarchaeota archaeon]
MKSVLSINEEQVGRTLTVQKSIQLARRAYILRAKKTVLEPLRTWFTVPTGASFYFMPAHVSGLGTVSVKVVTVTPRNRNSSLPSTSATIYVFDSKTGSELAHIAGNNLTAIRTAASSGLATDILASKQTDSLGVIGTGKQAQAHLPAMLEVRSVSQVRVYSRSKAHRKRFVRMAFKNTAVRVTATDSAEEVARRSDLLVLATSSRNPLFRGNRVAPRSHVNAIGASLPSSREMDTTLVKRSILVVDSREQAVATYGDIMIPLKRKAITKSHIRAELGELLLNPSLIERGENEITVFKAGGLAVLDAVFADYVVSQS